MSKTTFTLLLGLLLYEQALAQAFCPLSIGNEWYYHYISPSGDSTVSEIVTVLSDTTFSNGHKYSLLSKAIIAGFRFVRADSASIYFVGQGGNLDHRFFTLNGVIGDTVNTNMGPYGVTKLTAIDTATIFGFLERVFTFALDGLQYAIVRFSEHFGLISEWRYADPPAPWPEWRKELVGCSVGGITYGTTAAAYEDGSFPTSFVLYQNFPNPFNPETVISYSIGSSGLVSLRVFNLLGQEIRTLVNQYENAGHKFVKWTGLDNNGVSVTSGVYFYELRHGNYNTTRRMVFSK